MLSETESAGGWPVLFQIMKNWLQTCQAFMLRLTNVYIRTAR